MCRRLHWSPQDPAIVRPRFERDRARYCSYSTINRHKGIEATGFVATVGENVGEQLWSIVMLKASDPGRGVTVGGSDRGELDATANSWCCLVDFNAGSGRVIPKRDEE